MLQGASFMGVQALRSKRLILLHETRVRRTAKKKSPLCRAWSTLSMRVAPANQPEESDVRELFGKESEFFWNPLSKPRFLRFGLLAELLLIQKLLVNALSGHHSLFSVHGRMLQWFPLHSRVFPVSPYPLNLGGDISPPKLTCGPQKKHCKTWDFRHSTPNFGGESATSKILRVWAYKVFSSKKARCVHSHFYSLGNHRRMLCSFTPFTWIVATKSTPEWHERSLKKMLWVGHCCRAAQRTLSYYK